jgi:hypothetical protein
MTTNSLGTPVNNTIALHAVRTGAASNINDGTYILWNTLIVSSPYYNSSTGLFTAPIAGKYFLSGHVIVSTPASAYLRIYKNGAIVSYSHMNITGTYGHLTVTGIVQCNVGDTVGIGGTSFYGSEHNGYTLYYLGA